MDLSTLKKESERLKQALQLEGSLIGVSYKDEPDGDEEDKGSPCGAFLAAHQGKTVTLSKKNCICPGGISHLGFSDKPLSKKTLQMLVEGEKMWCSLAAANRLFLDIEGRKAPPPTEIGDYVNLVPLEELNYLPDLIISICDSTQASRFVILSGYQDGKVPSVEVAGSMCWSAITYPIVSGNFNVTMGDYTARRMWNWAPGKLLVSVPLARYKMILESLDECVAGFADPSPEFEKLTERIKTQDK